MLGYEKISQHFFIKPTKLARSTVAAVLQDTSTTHKKDMPMGQRWVLAFGESVVAPLGLRKRCFLRFGRSSREPPRMRGSLRHLNHTQKGHTLWYVLFVVGRGGFEPPKSKTSDLQSDPFGRSGICPYSIVCWVEPVIGLEPTTC